MKDMQEKHNHKF